MCIVLLSVCDEFYLQPPDHSEPAAEANNSPQQATNHRTADSEQSMN